MKKYSRFVNEEVGMRNLKKITANIKKAEIYFHKDLDGVTSAIAIKEFFKRFYDIETVDCHIIQYGGLEFAVKDKKPGNMAILVDFAHSKPMYTVATDHHDKQAGAEEVESPYFKSARSNVETISGEIAYSDMFTPQDVELIKTVDSADFVRMNITPEDVQNSIFKYKKGDTPEKNRFMMGFVVNRLLLAYKNKRITVTSLDGKRDHVNRNILECLVLDSSPSLYSIFGNIRHYVNSAVVSDKAGRLASAVDIAQNLGDYIKRMSNYRFVELDNGEVTEYDPSNYKHQNLVNKGAKIMKGSHFDEKYKIISQYGGGYMVKAGSYDRYVPFKNNPEADFICIVWPMGLIQVSCNPFKLKKLVKINLGEIAKEVLAIYQPMLTKFYVSLASVKKEYETSQDWRKMAKDEGPDYEGVGFRYSDLTAFYADCIYKKTGERTVVKCDITKEYGLEEAMNTIYDDLTESQKGLLDSLKLTVWEIVIRNSGGHPSITNIQGLNFMKYNKPALLKAYQTEKYTDVLKRMAKDFTNNLRDKIDIVNKEGSVTYAAKEIELLGQETNENFDYYLINKYGKEDKVTKNDFLKAGSVKALRPDSKDGLKIDFGKKKVTAKFEGQRLPVKGIRLNSRQLDFMKKFRDIVEDDNAMNVDKMSGVGDLLNKSQLTQDEIKEILDRKEGDWFYKSFLQPEYDQMVSESIRLTKKEKYVCTKDLVLQGDTFAEKGDIIEYDGDIYTVIDGANPGMEFDLEDDEKKEYLMFAESISQHFIKKEDKKKL